MLLIIPLVTLIGLLSYSFATTLPGFLADRNSTTINNDVGGPLERLLTQLNTEAALTYSLGSFPQPTPAQQRKLQQQMAQMPPAQAQQAAAKAQGQEKQLQRQMASVAKTLKAQRPKTDAAIAAFRAGQAKLNGKGLLPAQDQPMAAALVSQLKSISALRAEADHHTASALTVFKGYLSLVHAIFPYVGAMPNTDSPVPMFSQSMGTLFMGEASADVATEATLGTGALENGGIVTKPVYQLFQQTDADERQLDQSGTTMLNIAHTSGSDPYLQALASPQFKSFQELEDKVIADGPGAPMPVTPQAWQQQTGTALALLAKGETGERETVTANAAHESDLTEYELIGVSGLGLLLVLFSSLLLFRFGNRVRRELRSLRAAARTLAYQRLPDVVSRLRAGEDLEPLIEAPRLELNTRTQEVTQTADAFSEVQRTAVQAAIEESALRKSVNNVFRRLARRNQGLLQRQLKMLDEMEQGTQDPEALSQLFRLDHLTTRMRRQAEGLIILSGAAPGRGWRQPVQAVEVLRGAVGEIEDYVRVDLITDSPDYLQGSIVADVTHLLAELIENAVAYSPPTTRVQVRGGRVANGYAVEVEDRGLGIPPEMLVTLNQRLADPPDFDVADSDQLGLFVVSRLAARHGIQVSLRTSSYGGARAIVLLPPSLVVTPEEAAHLTSQEHGRAPLPAAGAGPSAGPGRATAGAVTAADGIPRATGALNALGAFGGTGTGPGGLPRRDGTGPGGLPRQDGTGPGGLPRRDDTGTGPGGLPRREKMANLPHQPRAGSAPSPQDRPAPRSPEQTRTLMSSIQRGLRTGRNSTDGESGSGSGFSGPGSSGQGGMR